MCVCVYLKEFELDLFSKVEDKDVNKLFQKLRDINKDFLLQEQYMSRYRLLEKKEWRTIYTVFKIIKDNEAQQLMIPTSSLSKKEVMAFLYGLLANIKHN